MRYFDFTIEEIDRLTIPDIQLLMKAYNLRQVDKAEKTHLQAWLTAAAGATKKDGRPVYDKFTKFFNKDAELKRLEKKPNNKFEALSKHLKDKRHGSK